MLKVRQQYRLRDLRKLRRTGEIAKLRELEAILSLFPARRLDGSICETPPMADDSLSSLEHQESLLKLSGAIPVESTVETESGNPIPTGP